MSRTEAQVLEAIDRIAREVIAPAAEQVDRQGAFPRVAIDALGQAGLLGLTVDPAVGGLGHGPRVAALVVERIARDCGSTAMIVCMHYSATAVLEKHAAESVRREVAAGGTCRRSPSRRSARAACSGRLCRPRRRPLRGSG